MELQQAWACDAGEGMACDAAKAWMCDAGAGPCDAARVEAARAD